jgi:Leucine-rich repeat (LRR) protein
MICGEEFSDDQCLRITSIEASKITNVYFYLESEVVLPTSNDVVSAKISRRFEQLEKKLTKLKALHVRWIDSKPETCRFSVEHYSNLEYLQLEGCPPSLIIGSFHHHFSRLKKLDIYGSDGLSLSRLFLPWRDKKIQCDFPPMTPYFECKEVPDVNKSWSSLSMVRLSKCGLVVLDNSLHYLPKLTEIDFSQNSISEIVHLQDCSKLTKLNLSINKIRVLSNISRVLGNISSLNIANNQVESLDGVQGLYALRTFDVSGNLIVDFQEIHHLNRLPCLESLTLIGNPISLPKMGGGKIPGGETNEIGLMLYRRLVFKNLITDRFIAGAVKSLPLLDDKPISPAQQQSFRFFSTHLFSFFTNTCRYFHVYFVT